MAKTRTDAIAVLLAAGWTPAECDAVFNHIEFTTIHKHCEPLKLVQPFQDVKPPKPPNPLEITCFDPLAELLQGVDDGNT